MKKQPLPQQLQLELDAAESRRRVCMLAKAIMSVLGIQPDEIALVPVLTGKTRCRTNEEAVRVWITNHLQAAAPTASSENMGPCIPIEVFETLDFDRLVSALQARLYECLPYIT